MAEAFPNMDCSFSLIAWLERMQNTFGTGLSQYGHLVFARNFVGE